MTSNSRRVSTGAGAAVVSLLSLLSLLLLSLLLLSLLLLLLLSLLSLLLLSLLLLLLPLLPLSLSLSLPPHDAAVSASTAKRATMMRLRRFIIEIPLC
jgi:hypothetical protein